MLYLVVALIILALILGPQFWVRHVMDRHAADRPDLPGTGGELARHLLDRYGLDKVGVETTTPGGDHYDPDARTVRLSPKNHDGRSITAVAVAAHEVAHAIQHAQGSQLFSLRTRLARLLGTVDKIAMVVLVAVPIVMIFTRVPAIGLFQFGAVVALLGLGVVVHLLTLPVEFDASFGKALPILDHDKYLHPDDMPAARGVLRAAAMTYVAASLMGLLDFLRILRVIR
ncbi:MULTISPECIES: zinc metallopeptidase [unclassified Bosea (in: a-proteobacteria)]|uniref:zinc metallopeptidase n=1 Tax=unclassified Bosea (in: a-proteobacteria) TaxID=2653178 RepID=UPI000F75F8F5|nr:MULTISPECIES: zinc metallopeptidase [unclassified Bosea (in: a-proteobacteria)]AZO79989.1 peptidase [Bosea sp. Tri-49]RXT22767.1 peptidase [Bosea sp. Tri-39]RXT38236.1 peptidase [Bosea sp. Tri-54]